MFLGTGFKDYKDIIMMKINIKFLDFYILKLINSKNFIVF